jgi:acyl carrier protein
MSAVLTRPEIVSELRNILQRATNNRIQADQVNEEDNVFDNLGLSSLEMLELSFEIEYVWNVVLDNEDLMDLKIVSDVIDLILERTAVAV